MRARGRIVILHFVGQLPLAGIAWQAINYLVGLQKLDLRGVVRRGSPAPTPRPPQSAASSWIANYNVEYLRTALEAQGFAGAGRTGTRSTMSIHGLAREQVHRLYAEADALINLCGANPPARRAPALPGADHGRHRPGFTSRSSTRRPTRRHGPISTHTRISSPMAPTSAAQLATCRCRMCRGGHPAAVDLDLWPAAPSPKDGRQSCFSTIATWENKGQEHRICGTDYVWSKHLNFLRFLDVPQSCPQTCFEMAMLPPDGEVRRLVEGAGWKLVDPRRSPPILRATRPFIAGSRGEFTVAKDIYVRPKQWLVSAIALSAIWLPAGRS